MHLRDTHFKGAESLGHQGYKYPHDYPHHYVNQIYLPDELLGHNYIKDQYPVDDNIERVLKFADIKAKSDLKSIDS